MAKKAFPSQAFQFFAPTTVVPTETGDRALKGIAYSGEVITDHWLAPVAFDLATMEVQTPLPVLRSHQDLSPVGVVDSVSIGQQCEFGGTLFTSDIEQAQTIAKLADKGFPWGMSLWIVPGSIEELQAGQQIALNGRNFQGPLTVFRNSRIREVSICSVAADQRTSAAVFAAGDQDQLQIEVIQMADASTADKDRTAQLERDIAEVTAKFTAATELAKAQQARADAAESALTEIRTKQRESEVREMFKSMGKEFSADAASPFLSMDDAQFSAAKGVIDAMKPKREARGDLFSHVATGGNGGEMTTDQINQQLRNQLGGVN